MKLLEDVPLAPLSSMGVGGPAQFFVEARSDAVVLDALTWAGHHGVAVRVLGGGSNVVVSDAGFDGLVLRIGLRGRAVRELGGGTVEIEAGAGEPWDELVQWTVERGLGGFECLSGIPGLVGATPIQNVGAYGQDVSESVAGVRVLDRSTKSVRELGPADCRFGYRDSVFKSGEPERFVVLGVKFRLRAGGKPKVSYPDLSRELAARGVEDPNLEHVRSCVLDIRRSKSMVLDAGDPNTRSCGSFFVNPVVEPGALSTAEALSDPAMPRWPQPDGRVKLSAAWLIERAGFSRGERLGRAGISSRHSLALVCHEGARASDIVALARRVRAGVEARFGIRLAPEPVFWGFSSLDGGLPDERVV